MKNAFNIEEFSENLTVLTTPKSLQKIKIKSYY
jgi:hypothetical protein